MNFLKKWLNQINPLEWKSDLKTVTVDNVSWQTWTLWVWTWQLNLPGKETLWYDGPHETWRFGFGALYKALGSNYYEKHSQRRQTDPKSCS